MDEYIKRSTVMHYLEGIATADEMAMNIAKAAVKRIPAEDVEPVRHGRWETVEFWKSQNKHGILYKTNQCSICHCTVSNRHFYNYCPNCGAKMDGGTE